MVEADTNINAAAPSLRRRGGRPKRGTAAMLGERIIAVATEQFIARGFGATSIESVTAACGISKRTFYHRFRDKPELFGAVVRRLVAHWTATLEPTLAATDTLEAMLAATARRILVAALSHEGLALYRMLIAEAPHFPALARIMNEQGGSAGIERLAHRLEDGGLRAEDARFAADQFVNMVVAGPRRRALGLGAPMTEAELDAWCERSVALFLDGCRPRTA